VSNIEEQLCIVFMYTGNLYHLRDLATFENIYRLLCLFLKRRGHIFLE
jgi:hypothetical protein